MKNIYRIFVLVLLGILMMPNNDAKAGNDDRRGTSGAAQLLINPWAKSSGWGGVNTASGKGLDAIFSNVAGLGHITGTEATFAYTNWFQNTGIGISSFGVGQSLGEYGVLGLSLNSMSFGLIDRTTVGSPDGNIGTFSPSLMNIGVSYARAFSNSIYGGATIKIITEGIDNVTATGFALDAGIQYVTGDNYEIKFGIALKNWGPAMSFSGDGLSTNATTNGSGHSQTVEQRSQTFELPSSLNIGASYDFLFDENNQRITLAGNFSSMAFSKDQYILGLEYGLGKFLMIRTAYAYEDKITSDIYTDTGSSNIFSGFSAGASVIAPLSKPKNNSNGISLAIDYSFRLAKALGGVHTIGLALSL